MFKNFREERKKDLEKEAFKVWQVDYIIRIVNAMIEGKLYINNKRIDKKSRDRILKQMCLI